MKRYVANVLLIVGLLLAGASAAVAHLARAVLDEDAFSARLVAALDRPAVANFVAREIAEGVVAANRDLTGVKPVITAMAQAVVNSAPFHSLARRGAREAHALLFSEGAERVILSMPDVGVLLRGTLETVSPDVARRIPLDVRTVIETRMTGAVGARVLGLLRAASRIRSLARWGVVAGMLLVAFALALAPRRRQALLDAGIGLLAIAATLALLVPLGRAAVAGVVADPAFRPLAAELWSAFADGIRYWAVGIGIVAVVSIATVAALIAPARLRAVALRGLHELAGRQATIPREIARIACLLVLGAFAVAAPLATLSVVTVVLGVLLLAVTVHAVVTLVAPVADADLAEAEPLSLNPALAIVTGLVVLVSAGFGAVAMLPRLRPTSVATASQPVIECNGSAALCDRRLDDVTLAGAHNAMGSADDPSWLFPNQDLAIPLLLQRGIRALLIDVVHGHPVEDRIKTDFETEEQRRKYEVAIGPEAFAAAMRVRDRLSGPGGPTGLYMCHGFCELGATPFDSALAQLRRFLVEHPGEVLLVVIEDRASPAELVAAFEAQGLGPYLYAGPWRAPFPTLGELVRSGRRLVVLGENQTDTSSWYHPAYAVMQETPYTFHAPSDFSCRRNRGDAKNPLFLMNHWIESTPSPRPSNAELVNTREVLVSRARECRRVRGKLPNVLAVDFAATGDVVGAAAVLNGLAPPGGAASAAAGGSR
ncbi:MAG TPA: hypothetical protein VFY20_03240 [Gemmatimonadales bacterium]|nr:hypothetical protein [Gemmatimonadales bacterium]